MDAKVVRELLDYSPETGLFTWRHREEAPSQWNTRFVGKPAGAPHSRGYLRIIIKRRQYFAHRLAWLHYYGNWPISQIDHINGVKTDNRISNLRCATPSTNQHNLRQGRVNNKTGLLGVIKCENRWQAQIKFAGKRLHIGTFNTPEAAHAAYLNSKAMLHDVPPETIKHLKTRIQSQTNPMEVDILKELA